MDSGLKQSCVATAIDLFSGAGGLTSGLVKAGFRVICGVDSWDVASESYRLNFDHPAVCADIGQLSAPGLWEKLGFPPKPVDLLVGGPPCQGFSIQRIGKNWDDRNNLVLEFGRLVREIHPRMFLMENVTGLLGKRGRELADKFETQMENQGYSVEAAKVNAADYGVPQIRRRIFYYGWLKGDKAFSFPPPSHTEKDYLTVEQVIGDLPSPPEDYIPSPNDRLHRRMRLSEENQRRIRLIPPGGGMEDLPPQLRVPCHRNGARHIGHRYVYGRLAPDKPAGTITARFDSFTRGKFGHPSDHRNITLREGARLQTFPDHFSFVGTQEQIAAQIGNAVPPRLASIIGLALIQHLSTQQTDEQASPFDYAFQRPLFQISKEP